MQYQLDRNYENGKQDMKEQMMFQAYVGQRMLIEDLAELVRPKEGDEDN